MKRLEFMRNFDDMQPEPSPEEQRDAAKKLGDLASNALLTFPKNIEYPGFAVVGDRAPRLTVYPLLTDTGVEKAYIAQAHNESGIWSYITLNIPQEDSYIGEVQYKAEADQIARRYDRGSRAAELKLVMTEQESIKERDANRELEQHLGLNNCPVKPEEIAALGAFIARMAPNTL